MDRVVASLLTELDQAHDGSLIFFLGATNRPDLLDPSLLRPGRLERLVYLGISPDGYQSILTSQMRKLKLNDDIDQIAGKVARNLPPNLTGADISSIVSGALMHSIERLCHKVDAEVLQRGDRANATIDLVVDSWTDEELTPVVTLEDMMDAALSIVPSVSAEEMVKYEKLRHQFSAE